MVGKRIMLSAHEVQNASIAAMLHVESVSLEQMTVVPHSFDADGLIAGKVDVTSAYATSEPALLQERGLDYNVIDPINYGIDFYGNMIFTSEQQVQANPGRVERFVRASLKGWYFALKQPEAVIEIIRQRYNTQDKSLLALRFEVRTLRRFILPDHIPLGTLDPERLRRIVDVYQQMGLVHRQFDLDALVYRGGQAMVRRRFRHIRIMCFPQSKPWVIMASRSRRFLASPLAITSSAFLIPSARLSTSPAV
jgi:ABC-type nitrate/sulfonate/bicarbonate transport system substrate-binding protein